MNPEDIARICHEANRAYCIGIGDNSQVGWDQAPQWQRESMMMGVIHFINNPGATPQDMHESWMAKKDAEGWVYGAVKNESTKTHPCMVSYNELPEPQRVKDRLFLAIARAIITGEVEEI